MFDVPDCHDCAVEQLGEDAVSELVNGGHEFGLCGHHTQMAYEDHCELQCDAELDRRAFDPRGE